MQKHELFLGYEGTQAAMLDEAPSIHKKSIEELVVMLSQAGIKIDPLRSEKHIHYGHGSTLLPLQAHLTNLEYQIGSYTLKNNGISVHMVDLKNSKTKRDPNQYPSSTLRSGVKCEIELAEMPDKNIDEELRTVSKVLREFYRP